MKVMNAETVIYNGIRYLGIQAPFTQIEQWLEANKGKLPCECEIVLKRKKRSTDANAYMWQLADKIADAIGVTKEEVYRAHIHDVGVFTDVAVINKAVQEFCEAWQSNGVGWIAEVQMDCKIEGCKKIRCYKGSSCYDTKQMSRLIDNMVQEAKSLSQHGVYIETLTPDELEQMMQKWGD